jgi:hypothetical protein
MEGSMDEKFVEKGRVRQDNNYGYSFLLRLILPDRKKNCL